MLTLEGKKGLKYIILSFYLKILKKKGKINQKAIKCRKEIIKIRAEINEIGTILKIRECQ